MKHVSNYLSTNPKLLKDFKKILLKEKNKTTSSTISGTYITKYSCFESFLKLHKTIIFFEWSNTSGSKKFFKTIEDFYSFLETSNIKYPDYNMRQIITNNEVIYFTCITGKNELVCGVTKTELDSDLKKALETKPQTSYNYPYNYEGDWD